MSFVTNLKMCVSVVTVAVGVAASGQTLTGAKLVQALQHGGYVIVMRHASSPQQPPAKENADPDNPGDERQLDARGMATAVAMGDAVRSLKIPIGEVLSSPAYRALETIKLARLGGRASFRNWETTVKVCRGVQPHRPNGCAIG